MTNHKPFTHVAAVVFLLVALVHLYRLVAGFEVVIAGQVMGPMPSIAGLVIGGLLSVMLWREAKA